MRMAAAPNRCAPDVVELSRLHACDLDTVLAEESLAWRSVLSWDYTESAAVVRRYLAMRSLSGYALVAGSQAIGYCYYVAEDHKGIVGDLYILQDWATPENEDLLLSSALNALVSTPGIERIEAQIMLLHGRFDRALPFARYGHVYPRLFMRADLPDTRLLPVVATAGKVSWEPWMPAREEESARLLAQAYRDHLDSNINDQYRSVAGARKFLYNIVHYPGCGRFHWPGSIAAYGTGQEMAGLVLASRIAPDTGHITQICVSPEWKGRGLGYELLRRSLIALSEDNYERVTLTVTAENHRAIQLYQNVGFRSIRRFAAYVWDQF